MLTVRDAVAYPFGVPDCSFVVADGSYRLLTDCGATEARSLSDLTKRSEAVAEAWIDLALAQPIALLTCGSNASPTRLVDKLASAAVGRAIALRVRCTGWTPVYSATISYYGAAPATFMDDGSPSEPFLLLIDRQDFDPILRTETRTANYDAVALTEGHRRRAGLPVDLEMIAFVSRYGALLLDGEAQRLVEFQSNRSNGVTQRQVLSRLLATFQPGLSVDAYVEAAMLDPSLIDRFRAHVREASLKHD